MEELVLLPSCATSWWASGGTSPRSKTICMPSLNASSWRVRLYITGELSRTWPPPYGKEKGEGDFPPLR